ncbi:MAG: TrkH family potassium uptake protein [Bacteroidales bacterium]|nr:TrkH family potassium uptake protein [Bacteroidales bacterium]
MNLRVVVRYVGIALLFNAFLMLLSLIVSIIYGTDSAFSPLLFSTFITAVVGVFPLLFVREAKRISLADGFAITIFSWLLSCFFGMLPYFLWGGPFTFINAWFESVSGYTTTGATILSDIEALPHSLLFWRSSTHFIGGTGVVFFMLLVLPTMSTFRMKLSQMELSSLSRENYNYQTKRTMEIIAMVYLGLLVCSFFAYLLAGMNPFDAINHAMSVSATGGFSTKNESIHGFNSFGIELVTMIFMLVGSIHFAMIFSAVTGKPGKMLKSPVIRYYVISCFAVSIILGLHLLSTKTFPTLGESMRHSFFQVISVCSTTGFATADSSVWPPFAILILVLLTTQGACSGSTAGGLKIDRVWIFIKSVGIEVRKMLHPNAVIQVRTGGVAVPRDVVQDVTFFIAFYFIIALIFSALLAFTGMDILDSTTSSFASIANVGPGFGTVGSLENYGQVPSVAKFLMSIEMFLGRMEIFPLLIIFSVFKHS